MKKVYPLFLIILVCLVSAVSLELNAQGWCITDEMYLQEVAENPDRALQREIYESQIQEIIKNNPDLGKGGNARIIPVVFHVIHENGSENITRPQMLDQLRILNEDFRRLNPDTVNTPGPFKAVAADANIEFRIAQKDPSGNCTDGVVRVFSALTTNARNNVKALSYWPSNKYLNIWIVRTIENVNGTPGFVIGFAQFPGGSPLTDGVVLRADYTGSILTANNNHKGRTATHEVGHWLNLRHIWGDTNCGDDQVADTPQHAGANQSNCPTFPKFSACPQNGPNGDMFSNYMDYTNGNCQNIVTQGQSARMNAALSSFVSGRDNLWSPSNLVSTGTDGTAPVLCSPVAAFTASTTDICEGTAVNFTDWSWRGAPDTWSWTFTGGTPSTSSAQHPSVVYNTPGKYDVTLTVTNAAGTNTQTKTVYVNVHHMWWTNKLPFSENFESGIFKDPGYYTIINEGGNGWDRTNMASSTGQYSAFIYNFGGNVQGKTDAFISPAFDLTNTTGINATFKVAFAVRSSTSADQLRVYASTTCGQFWTARYTKSGTALATAGLVSSNFIPTGSQWREETISLNTSSFTGKPNVKLMFEYTHDTGNNIFVDDLNITGIVGINDGMKEIMDISVFPNPAEANSMVSFTMEKEGHVVVKLIDLLGRELKTLAEGPLAPGEYSLPVEGLEQAGVYFINFTIDNQQVSRKLIIK
jgi:PKD repeat protein